MGAPSNFEFRFPGFENGGMQQVGDNIFVNPVKQRVYRTHFPDSILNPPVKWLGEGFNSKSLEQQFIPYEYPLPGHSEIRMFYRHGGSFIGTLPAGGKWVRAYQSPKLEFMVNQDCWWCGETRFADVILPACTNFERDDIGEFGNCGWMSPDTFSGNIRRVIVYMKKCVEPLWESKPDYWIYSQLAARLGMEQEYTEGRSEEEWIRKYYDWSDLHKMVVLGGVQGEGLLPCADSEANLYSSFAVVRRGSRMRHARPRQSQAGYRQGEGARHPQRQDRVRIGESEGAQPRPFRTAAGAAVHPQLGRPRDRRVDI